MDGPLAGDPNLTVEEFEDGTWPKRTVFTTGPGPDERFDYEFVTVALSTDFGRPAYQLAVDRRSR